MTEEVKDDVTPTEAPAPEPTPEAKPDATPEPEKKEDQPWYIKEIGKLRAEKRAAHEQSEALLSELAKVKQAAPKNEPKPDAKPESTLTEAEIDRRVTLKAQEIADKKAFDDKCNQAYEAGKQEFADFDDSLRTFAALGGMKPDVLDIATELKDGHRVLYELGRNPDETLRILALPEKKMAIELARMEANLNKGKPVSKAPPPIRTVDGKGKADVSIYDDGISMEDYIRLRDKQMAEKFKR